jgi:hypothetical protein
MLPEAMEVEVVKAVLLPRQVLLLVKVITGGGKIPRVLASVAEHPWLLVAVKVTLNVPLFV